jgi:pyroglutamyl-peptidase
MMNKKLLITGFDRFGPAKRANPSSEIVLPALERAYPDTVETRILPTVFGEAPKLVADAIEEIDPAAIILFGMAPGRHVKIERFARNWRSNVLTPDNDGSRGIGRLNREGPAKLHSTIPADELYASLHGNIAAPLKLSTDAGRFVCNATMYETLLATRAKNIPVGFVHIGNHLDRQTIEQAAVAIVDVVGRSASFR